MSTQAVLRGLSAHFGQYSKFRVWESRFLSESRYFLSYFYSNLVQVKEGMNTHSGLQ